MIHHTGKPPSPLPKSFNNSTGKFSTRGTWFNESSWGEQTHGLVKLIVHKLWQESYDKVVAGTKEIVKRTRSSVRTEEVIDLTSDKPADEFTMIVDLPSDEEDGDEPPHQIHSYTLLFSLFLHFLYIADPPLCTSALTWPHNNHTHFIGPISLIWWTYDFRFTCIYFYS